jgi:hypothetical protein
LKRNEFAFVKCGEFNQKVEFFECAPFRVSRQYRNSATGYLAGKFSASCSFEFHLFISEIDLMFFKFCDDR